MKQKIIVTFTPPPEVQTVLEKEFEIIPMEVKDFTAAKAIQLATMSQAHAMMVSGGQSFKAGDVALLPTSVKIIATCSVGYDHLDVAAFKRNKIFVTNTPDVLTAATADLTMLLLLGAARRIEDSIELTNQGWGKKLGQADMLGVDLEGKKLAIIGMGRIGQAVAARARAFGMEILYSNRKQLPPELEQGAKYFSNYKEMLKQAQVLSLHAPGSKETDKIMNDETFGLLPQGAIFINVARGSLVDEEALFKSLEAKHLFAVGLDVCMNEPNPDPRFLKYSNVLMTPHVGSATRETRTAMGLRALSNIKQALSGETPKDNLVN